MDPKPGFKTTEFWLLILGFLVVVLSGFTVSHGVISFALDIELLKWWLLGGGGYAVSRGMTKGGVTRPPAEP